jgi:hypothetical protein
VAEREALALTPVPVALLLEEDHLARVGRDREVRRERRIDLVLERPVPHRDGQMRDDLVVDALVGG